MPLRAYPRLRRILLAYTVNELGTWFGYVALALAVYDHTHSAIATAGLFVARGLLPALLAPVLVVHTERYQRRGVLSWLCAAQALLTVGLAALVWRFSVAGVLVLVAVDGIIAVAATALIRASAARVAMEDASGAELANAGAPETAQRQANAALNFSFMLMLAIGPAIGGVLVHEVGGAVALLIDAVTFLVCSGLLAHLHTHVQESLETSIRARLGAAMRHISEVPQLRTLLITEAIAVVFFASVEPVEVIYAKSTLHASALGYGLLLGLWGVGAAIGAVIFARSVHRPLAPMLRGGTLLVGIAYLGFAVAPTLSAACGAAVIGGIGNGTQWPSLISAVQQLTPPSLHGRLMSAVGSLNALCPAIGFALGGSAVVLSSPRGAMVVAGAVATMATTAFVRLPLGDLHSGAPSEFAPPAEPELTSAAR